MVKKTYYKGQNISDFAKSDYGATGVWLVERREDIQKLQNHVTATLRHYGWVANIKYQSGPAVDKTNQKLRWWIQVTLPDS